MRAEDAGHYAQRRKRVAEAIGADGALIIAAAPELHTGRDGELRYRPDSEFYYLTGFREPESLLVITAQSETLFVRPREPDRELWTGPRLGVDAAREVFGSAHAIPDLAQTLPSLVRDCSIIYARTGVRPDIDGVLTSIMQTALARKSRTGRAPLTLADPALVLDELRIHKDIYEIDMIREAARITVEGFRATASRIAPGKGEWEVEAAIDYEFRSRGGDGAAFPTIVAAGSNANILHYVTNDQKISDGDLLLIDAGARYRMYCADVSRTFPANRRFSAIQRDAYNAVLEAQRAAIAAVRPGVTIDDIHSAATAVLRTFARDARLLDSVRAEDEDAALRAIYPHKTSHWLGIDVHDPGDYVVGGAPRALEPGMVFTVEPGLYLSRLRFGIRLEDDVLVTETGCEVLTREMPIAADDVERLMHD